MNPRRAGRRTLRQSVLDLARHGAEECRVLATRARRDTISRTGQGVLGRETAEVTFLPALRAQRLHFHQHHVAVRGGKLREARTACGRGIGPPYTTRQILLGAFETSCPLLLNGFRERNLTKRMNEAIDHRSIKRFDNRG